VNKYREALDRYSSHLITQEPFNYKDQLAVEHLRELVDKESPRRPIETKYTHKCPNCKNQLPLKVNALNKKAPKLYCDRCGQKINWGNVRDYNER
jgi:DNA-directed RNA polymerase subunit RPC12/RpoP